MPAALLGGDSGPPRAGPPPEEPPPNGPPWGGPPPWWGVYPGPPAIIAGNGEQIGSRKALLVFYDAINRARDEEDEWEKGMIEEERADHRRGDRERVATLELEESVTCCVLWLALKWVCFRVGSAIYIKLDELYGNNHECEW
jgi:hypothetical protein